MVQPGKPLNVYHEYVPFSATGDIAEGHTGEELSQRFCATKKDLRVWNRMRKGEPDYLDPSRFGPGADVRYLLTPNKVWNGPTELTLKVRKSKDTAMVVSCLEGLKRVNPTLQQVTYSNYGWTDDIHLMFLMKEEAPKIAETGMGGPNMGMGVPNMGMGVPNMGMGVPNMGMGGPNMGRGVPNMAPIPTPSVTPLNQPLPKPSPYPK